MTRAPSLVALALTGVAVLTGCGDSGNDDESDSLWSQITSSEAEDLNDVPSLPFDPDALSADANVLTVQTAQVGQCVETTT